MGQSKGKLRITGGEFRGRYIEGPGKSLKVRPPLAQIRETLFNILRPRIQGARVLDLFAGTGVIGLEALSRGAKSVWFVEGDRLNVAKIERSCVALGVEDRVEVLKAYLPKGLKRVSGEFDLVLCDPPFDTKLGTEVLSDEGLVPLIAPDGLVVLRQRRGAPDFDPPHFSVTRRHKAGESDLIFLERKNG